MVVEARRVTEPVSRHLDAMEVAGYIDRTVPADRRARTEAHLAECGECREEVVDATRIARRIVAPRPLRRLWIPLAAAAVLLMFVRDESTRNAGVVHRESPVTTTVAPRGVAPVGPVDSVAGFAWSSVPRSDTYRVLVFTEDGTVVWSVETRDTAITLPPSVAIQPERVYFWKVEAQTGFGRSAASELTEFRLHRRR